MTTNATEEINTMTATPTATGTDEWQTDLDQPIDDLTGPDWHRIWMHILVWACLIVAAGAGFPVARAFPGVF